MMKESFASVLILRMNISLMALVWIGLSRMTWYQKMRGMSYQEVLRTNGQISFPEVLRQQKRL